jgi:hypothetical protein
MDNLKSKTGNLTHSFSLGEGGPRKRVGRGMRAIMLDDQKPEDLLQGMMTNPVIGLLCCTNF